MKLTEHFTLEEITYSRRAETLGIDNNPTIEHTANICEAANGMLEPLRREWGSGIIVSSGYRSPELNAATKNASKTSAHAAGFAFDLVPANGRMAAFKQFCKQWCKQHAVDQCIDERNASGSEWMHLGYKNAKGQQRRQFLKTTDGVHYKNERV